MTVQDRLRQRFEIGFGSANEADRKGLSFAFPRLCETREQAAAVSRLVRVGQMVEAFSLLSPRFQLQAVEFVEGKPLAKSRPVAEDGDEPRAS